ncbi:MAG: cytochrome c biogenesis protein CcsA [Ignavibacteria bacterium]|jgi:cytochrome c-type biogenesis protein CcmF|nr:cytochrome c biogenesis protein CcsA [Ignavibacteria bacterium]
MVKNKKNARANNYLLLQKIYLAFFVIVLLCFVINIYNFVTDNFIYSAVYEHSSISQPLVYKISASFSGQSGSFLLWLLSTTVVGLFLWKDISKEQPKGDGRFSWLQIAEGVFIAFLIILCGAFFSSNPFGLTPQYGGNIVDGLGQSILLQSPYNLLHPPLLFIGFSLLLIPFCIAVAVLVSKDYANGRAMSLILKYNKYGMLFLFAGLGLGSLWAYHSLGWGGFWGWDTIENAALIPLLLSFALLHCGIIYKRKNGLLKTSYLLALLTFPTILLCTFLARSGIAANYSMHSYVSGSNLAVTIIFYCLSAILLFSIGLFIFSIRSINKCYNPQSISEYWNKHLATAFGITLLVCIAFVVVVGTLLPILSGYFGFHTVGITSQFYMSWLVPLSSILLILLGLEPMLKEYKISWTNFTNRLLLEFSLGIVVMLVAFFCGVSRFDYLIITFATTFAFVSVLHRSSKRSIAATLTHTGLCVFIAATMLYGNFYGGVEADLQQGEPVMIGDYRVEFVSMKIENIGKYIKYTANMKCNNLECQPAIYIASSNIDKPPQLVPDVVRIGLCDLYIEPLDYYLSPNQWNSTTILRVNAVQNPFMVFVWFGGVMMLVGIVVGIVRKR